MRRFCGAMVIVQAGVLVPLASACGQSSQVQTAADAASTDGATADSSSGASNDASSDDGPAGDSSSAAPSDAGADADAAAAETDAATPDAAGPSDGPDESSAATDAPSDAGESGDGFVLVADANCRVEIDRPPPLPGTHVPIGTAIQWDSNPPSSGPHYPIWAAYQAYTSPVPRGYYVHNLEHGAVVLLYNCGDAGCPDVVAALQGASDAIPDDPLCTSAGQGVRVRTVITPDPLLDVPVAAAAWGWVYRAECADLPTLRDFALRHYGQGPEVNCGNGTPQF